MNNEIYWCDLLCICELFYVGMKTSVSLTENCDAFLKERAGLPAISEFLFGHERFLDQTLSKYVFSPGTDVYVVCPVNGVTFNCPQDEENTRMLAAKVECVVGSELLVKFSSEIAEGNSSSNNLQTSFVQMDQVHLVSVKGDGSIAALLENDRSLLNKRLKDFLQVGQFFELQKKNTLNIYVVKIISDYGGLVEVDSGHGMLETLHITSERCHPIGWTTSNKTKGVLYQYFNEFSSCDLIAHATPKWLFEYNPLKDHKFKVGTLLEMLDPEFRMVFYPAVVTKIFNKHYFSVRAIKDLEEGARLSDSPKVEYLTAISTDIYPVGWCSKHGVRLTVPKGMTETDFSYPNLWRKLREKLWQLNVESKETVSLATDDFFAIPKTTKKVEKIRYCEIQSCSNPLNFSPAAIVRSRKHLLWLHVETAEKCTAPRIYSNRSSELFPWNYAKNNGFELTKSGIQLSLNIRRFDLSNTFTNSRTTIFRDNKKKFMNAVWTKGDLWLPAVYVHNKCFCGPFLNADKLKTIPLRYGPGPLPLVMASMIKDILQCAYRITQLIELVAADKFSKLPCMQIKTRQLDKRYRVNVEICEQVAEFPGWLRMFLTQLDACPNLFSLEKRDVCPLYCAQIAALPYMQVGGHVNTSLPNTQQQCNRIIFNRPHRRQPNNQHHSQDSGTEEDMFNITAAELLPLKRTIKRELSPQKSNKNNKLINLSAEKSVEGISPRKLPRQFSASSTSSCGGSRTSSPSNTPSHNHHRISMAHCIKEDYLENNECILQSPRKNCTLKTAIEHDTEEDISSSSGSDGEDEHVVQHQPSPILYKHHPKQQISPKKSPLHSSPVKFPATMTSKSPSQQYPVHYHIASPSKLNKSTIRISPQNWSIGPTLSMSKSPSEPRPPLFSSDNSPIARGCPSPIFSSTPVAGIGVRGPKPSSPPLIQSQPSKWSCEQLAEWIKAADYPEFAKKLIEQEVDGEAILLFKIENFLSLGLKLGPAVKIVALVDELKKVEKRGY